MWLPGLAGSKNFESEFILDLDAYRKRKRPRELKLPPVVCHLKLAESFQSSLEAGEVPTRAALARQHGLTRARVTQLLDLLKLDPTILEYVHSLPAGTPEGLVTEKNLRGLVRLAPQLQIREAERRLVGFAAHRAERHANRVGR
ncbi:MAG: hypothetical protein JWO36_3184 [Myxococcales bacterium]|nr:hypothetical protein [Myxococcales bacterium]